MATQRSGMTDAQYEETKARIQRTVDVWKSRLGLGWWTLTTVYETDRSAFRDVTDDGAVFGNEAIMECAADWQYAKATIRVNMEAVAETDDATLEEYVVHELCHCLVAEMRLPEWSDAPNAIRQTLRDHEERVVTGLTKAFGWTLLAGAGELDGDPGLNRDGDDGE